MPLLKWCLFNLRRNLFVRYWLDTTVTMWDRHDNQSAVDSHKSVPPPGSSFRLSVLSFTSEAGLFRADNDKNILLRKRKDAG